MNSEKATYCKPSPSQMERIRSKPPCFTSQQWSLWIEAARMSRPSKIDSYCSDCTSEYKGKMLSVGKCVWPCVEFSIDKDGFICGKRKSLRAGE